VDERIRRDLVDEEISLGDYVLTGGELAAMVVMDAVTRLLPGVLGGADSAEKDSFTDGLLEHPHYTRPRVFEGEEVPEVLLRGHHGEIDRWRLERSLLQTALSRPDLLVHRGLSAAEATVLRDWCSRLEEILQKAPGREGEIDRGH
jgi:tRNA (guanine37-N1)-methyltransferase